VLEGRGQALLNDERLKVALSRIVNMITDIHRHFVPSVFFDFVKARPEFSIKVKPEEGESIDVDIREMHFGLNKTFFELADRLSE
jgi:hypothetical protein